MLFRSDGSAIRLTTAKYYTPGRKVIHEKGVTPDIVVPVTEEDLRALMRQKVRETWGDAGLLEDEEKSEGEKKDGEKKPEENKPVRDAQLDRAIDLLKGIKVFTEHRKTAT